MSAKVKIGEGIAKPAAESKPAINSGGNGNQIEVELVKCECCGWMEDCTPAYIAKIRERYHGRWICGLCSEAVKDEICRSERLISTEEAINRHISFSKSFRSAPPPTNPTKHLIAAMRQVVRRSLDSPRAMRSTPASPRGSGEENGGEGAIRRLSLARSESCFSTLGR